MHEVNIKNAYFSYDEKIVEISHPPKQSEAQNLAGEYSLTIKLCRLSPFICSNLNSYVEIRRKERVSRIRMRDQRIPNIFKNYFGFKKICAFYFNVYMSVCIHGDTLFSLCSNNVDKRKVVNIFLCKKFVIRIF